MAKILVVEDEPTIRVAVCDILSASYECHAVRTAEEGLALLAEGPFDVIITDLKLPHMDGIEFMYAARAAAPTMPVILISGGYGYDRTFYREEGAFGYLLKPFRAADLEALVAQAVGGKA